MKREVETNLIGTRVRFHDVPNEAISQKLGTIRGVYKDKDHRVVFMVQLEDGTLIDYASPGFFMVLP